MWITKGFQVRILISSREGENKEYVMFISLKKKKKRKNEKEKDLRQIWANINICKI